MPALSETGYCGPLTLEVNYKPNPTAEGFAYYGFKIRGIS